MTDSSSMKTQGVAFNEEIPGKDTKHSSGLDANNNNNNNNNRELQDLKQQLAQSQIRLAHLSEAQRLLAAQIRQADLSAHPIKKIIACGDDQTIATTEEDCCCDDTTVLSSEEGTTRGGDTTTTADYQNNNRARAGSTPSVDPTELRLCQITDELTQAQTADLLALQNAAQMLQVRVRLSSQEAVLAVHDAVQAQSALEEWKRRALRAERKCMNLYTENVSIKAQNEKLAAERRVLIKEVRKMRKQKAEKQDYWQQFESYIKGAMNMHEQQLRKKPSTDSADDSFLAYSSDEGATVTLKTNKPIHVESEQPSFRSRSATASTVAATPPQCGKQEEEESDSSAFVPIPNTPSRAEQQDSGPPQERSRFGGGSTNGLGNMNRETNNVPNGSALPPERIHVYPGDCVSPAMSFDGVWLMDETTNNNNDSHHSSKSSSIGGDGDFDKECSGCASLQDNN